jgi:hypothetical protein
LAAVTVGELDGNLSLSYPAHTLQRHNGDWTVLTIAALDESAVQNIQDLIPASEERIAGRNVPDRWSTTRKGYAAARMRRRHQV